MMKALFPALFLATPLWAGCPPGATVLVNCTLENGAKVLTTCQLGDQVSYEFGRVNAAPDLALTHHVRDVDMTPWPGIGIAVWEDFTLKNQGHAYKVYYSFRRDPDALEMKAGVVVSRAGAELAHIACDPVSIDIEGGPLPIFFAKQAAGQVWSYELQQWQDTQ